jgi:hypothetical protein
MSVPAVARSGRASWLTRCGTACLDASGLLEQERWIGTGFYAHVRVTRVNDGAVRLRARPGRFFTVWIVVLLAWRGSRLRVIPLNWQAMAGARSELARPRGQLARRAACRGIRSPRCMLLALLWAIAGGVGPDGAPASLMVDR